SMHDSTRPHATPAAEDNLWVCLNLWEVDVFGPFGKLKVLCLLGFLLFNQRKIDGYSQALVQRGRSRFCCLNRRTRRQQRLATSSTRFPTLCGAPHNRRKGAVAGMGEVVRLRPWLQSGDGLGSGSAP